MINTDRMVHAELPDGAQVVRYDRAGKWYIEQGDGSRKQITIAEAVRAARAGEWFRGRPGGKTFDARMSSAEPRTTP